MKFYTNVLQHRGQIFVRGYDNGEQFFEQVKYNPYLFAKTDKPSEFKNIQKENVEKISFSSMAEARQFLKEYKDVDGFDIYGMENFVYTYIYDNFFKNGRVEYERNLVRTATIDIETDASGSFPNVEEADKEINAVTITYKDKKYTLGFFDYVPEDKNTIYIKCGNEASLLRKMIKILQQIKPDLLTGWFSEAFDFPYITNRCRRILGEEETKLLSPWGIITQREVFEKGMKKIITTWGGITLVDYINVYKKFETATEEMYSLDFIANKQLGVGKIDYGEYGSLHQLYVQNKPKFFFYNTIDCVRIDQIENKLKLFDVLLSLAYLTGTNLIDAFATVRPWDTAVHNYLMDRKTVVPTMDIQGEDEEGVMGGYVRDPEPGLHKLVVSFDVKSLYPSLVRQCNISPDTIITTLTGVTIDNLLEDKVSPEIFKRIKEQNVSMCATGVVFDNSFEGVIPAIMTEAYGMRVIFQDRQDKADAKLEELKQKNITSGPDFSVYESESGFCRAQQQATKIFLNGGFGALLSRFYRWYDKRLGESITATGQYVLKHLGNEINLYFKSKGCKKPALVYGDTDSLYLALAEYADIVWPGKTEAELINLVADFCKNELQTLIDKTFSDILAKMNHRTKTLKMAREVIARSGFWTAKKRYALAVWDMKGLRYAEPQIKMQGLEPVKNSVPRVLRGMIKEAIKTILLKDEKDLQKYVSSAFDKFKEASYEEISTTRNTDSMSNYHFKDNQFSLKTPIVVRGALMYNHMIDKLGLEGKYKKIQPGEKAKSCYLKMPNPINCNIISVPLEIPKEFGLDDFIDYRLQFEKNFIKPLTTITEVVKMNLEEVNSFDDLLV